MGSQCPPTAPIEGDAVPTRQTNAGDPRTLDGFLAEAGATVVDVTRGAAPGTRRLLLGDPGGGPVSYVVAVADDAPTDPVIEREVRVLTELRAEAAPTVLATLPQVVAAAAVGERPAVVMTTVTRLRPRERRATGQSSDGAELDAVLVWLDALWRSTTGLVEPVDLGRRAADQLIARCVGSRRLAPVLGAVHDARRRLGRLRVGRTATHGCLCPRHVQVHGGLVTGVDDWSLATMTGEPVRDLGSFAVQYARSRLPEIIAGDTGPAGPTRDFVVAGLVAAGLPGIRWRDVLVLAQAERAIDALEEGRRDDIALLAALIDALPLQSGEPEASP
jgi:hypothetical protein